MSAHPLAADIGEAPADIPVSEVVRRQAGRVRYETILVAELALKASELRPTSAAPGKSGFPASVRGF